MRMHHVIICFVLILQVAAAQQSLYMSDIKNAVEKGWKELPAQNEQWKKSYQPSPLWGYNSPGGPVYLASTLAFLFEETKDKTYARQAAELLLSYSDLREAYPKEYWNTRVEYQRGVPVITNFFYMAPYIRAYLRIKDSGVIDDRMKKKIEEDVAGSADFIFHFPEWGAHNRAILRAEALLYAAIALPDHPNAPKWKAMAEIIAGDNLTQWEIEDATGYHAVWLMALYSYAEAANRPDLFDSPLTKYYLKYFVKLIAPYGIVPEFGDSRWTSGWESLRFVPIFEKGAAIFKDPEMKWAAQRVYESAKKRLPVIGVGEAYYLSDAFRWTDEKVKAQQPVSSSQEVLEDMIGKKIVFRNGWKPQSTYMLLNYKDEGDGGWLGREYLRQTISVEEEKMHHGHADENSIALLMNKGSVLLHDADYRDSLPSGIYGAWRQDYFHNRLVARLNKRDGHQSVLEFVQNSGAYRQVRTQKIDFLNLNEVDVSRTRVTDDKLGYQWDRVVVYVKQDDFFIVVDGVKVLKPDYFTFTNFWHSQRIMAKGNNFVDLANDSIQRTQFLMDQSLLLYFPETYAKTMGVEPIRRSGQQEQAVYQSISSQYHAGDMEVFVSVLVPHKRGENLEPLLKRVRQINVSAPYQAVGLEIDRDGKTSTLGVKLDLDMEVARENIRPRYLYDLGKVSYGDYETDAHVLFATKEGNQVQYSASNVLKVRYNGTTLMEALPNVHGLQLDGARERDGYSKWRYWEETVKVQ
ncbi:MAG: hypothetical protein V1799_16845 [bacterium]